MGDRRLFHGEQLVAVVRAPSADAAVGAAQALWNAGIRVIEITFTVPDAAAAITRIRERLPDALVGAGTLTSPDEVDLAVAAGATFLVSPGTPAPLLDAMVASGVSAIPGVGTPTEAMGALAAGARAVKWFPACTLGPEGLRTLLGPFPDLAVVPTGGIASEEVPVWLAAGAVAVGLGSQVCPAGAVTSGRWDVVEHAAREAIRAAGLHARP